MSDETRRLLMSDDILFLSPNDKRGVRERGARVSTRVARFLAATGRSVNKIVCEFGDGVFLRARRPVTRKCAAAGGKKSEVF